jgi:hypothetical protein
VLSLALGIPVGELQNRLTASEFAEYLAYYSIEPFGDLRSDFQTGIVASILQNLILGFGGSKEKPTVPLDFVIHGDGKSTGTILDGDPGAAGLDDDDAELRRQSQERMIAALKAIPGKGKPR